MDGLSSYESGTKDTWRNWQWNRLVERLPALHTLHSFSDKDARLVTSQSTVIYLSGPDDHDRKCGILRGFKNENLIAVDVKEDNIRKVRDAGGFGVCGRLEDVILCWPGEWPIDAIVADTCSGIGESSFDLIKSILQSRACSNHTVIAFNGFRGRDKWSNDLRHAIHSVKRDRSQQVREFVPQLVGGYHTQAGRLKTWHDISTDHLHRGKVWFRLYCCLVESLFEDGKVMNHAGKLGVAFDPFMFMLATMPVCNSYESLGNSHARMDSIVFRMGIRCGANFSKSHVKTIIKERESVLRERKQRRANLESVTHRISALRAIRTKYLKQA